MARRRLLSILAASVVLSAALAGPAFALEVVDPGEAPVVEVAEQTVEASDEPVAAVVDTADAEAVEEVADAARTTVAPEPSPSATPSPTRDEERVADPADTTDTADTADTADADEPVVAAGQVAAAPSLASLTGTGGSAPAPQSRLELPLAAPAEPDMATVEAPLVADAPTAVADAPAPSVLAQPATTAVPDEGTPVLVLVAFASLLAAGSATVREARVAATG